MGCTIRIADRLWRVEAGTSKSSFVLPVKRPSTAEEHVSMRRSPPNAGFNGGEGRVCRTCGVANLVTRAFTALAPSKDSEVVALEGAERDGGDDGSGQRAEEQQHERDQKDDR